MTAPEEREALQAAILETLSRWRLAALDVQAAQIALRIRDDGYRLPQPEPTYAEVLAAAQALFGHEQCARHEKEDLNRLSQEWHSRLDEQDQAEYLEMARAALTAARKARP